MAITHYIDTSLIEIARSRVKSQTNRVPEAFPVLVYGDTRDHNFIFMNQGTIESFSGNASYSLRVTLGEVQLGPKSGSYTLTCGTSVVVDALSDASTVEAALNGLTTITSDGGVTVSGTFPNFLVTWNTVGVKTAFTTDATKLVPQSTAGTTQIQTGSATVRNQVMLTLRQAAIVSKTNWTTISSPAAGWTGAMSTNTTGALTLLSAYGEQVGDFVEVTTVITVEALDSNSVPITYYQAPIVLRAKNLDSTNTVTNGVSYYTLGDTLYGSAAGTLVTLPGSNSTTRKFLSQTGDGTNSAKPNWSTISAADFPPSGPNASVQVNIGGAFYGDANLTYEPLQGKLSALRYTGTWTNGINASNVNTGTIPNAVYGFGTNVLAFLNTPNSDNLRYAVTDETGTGGGLVFANSPNLITPNIGAASGSALTLSALTSGRVPFATTGGLLTDAAGLTFNSGTGTLTATTFSGSGASLTSIPNSALTNSAITLGTTSVSLGATSLTLAGLTSVGTNSVTSAAASVLTLATADTNRQININPNGSGNVVVGSTFGTGTLAINLVNGITVDPSGTAGADANIGLRTATYNAGSAIYLSESTGKIFLRWSGAGGIHVHSTTPAFTIDGTTASISTTTGALQVAGGLGVAGAGYFGGLLKTTTISTTANVTWDLGAAAVVSPTSPNRTLAVIVGGTTYYIAAKTTND